MKSSLGFHTMSLSLPICYGEYYELLGHFIDYSKRTHDIRIYRVDQKNQYHHLDERKEYLPLKVKISFVKYRGITWTINNTTSRYCTGDYVVNVTINPKFLAGIQTYITAANLSDMDIAISNFNQISRSISPILSGFHDYRITRIDYCVNLSLSELVPGCPYDQVMNLIKRSNIPSRFKEWTCYDNVAHRTKTKPGSFYLMNRSVHINCYSKYMKLLEQSDNNMNHGYPPIPIDALEASKDIIRFEVQCKALKMMRLYNSISEHEDPSYNKYRSLLHPIFCADLITKYYWSTIGKGDWYSFTEAVRKIEQKHYNIQKQKRLISVIKLVNSSRSVSKLKENLSGDKLRIFNLTIKDLMSIRINPVTIPREWGIPHIKDPLNEFGRRTHYNYIC